LISGQPGAKSIYNLGEIYKFNVHHVIDVDDAMEVFTIELEEVSA
jgi:hypothetical protein